ncbi:MAG: B12-binding domain-containing radical SAM protein [Syntrophorhabdaceae bacterium]|nr:B12-binding domain-containing radical SAM protein [Syntrophorhabdaceae bacterium]
MKVLFLYPSFPDTFWSFRHALPFIGKRSSFPPLGLMTVSAMLPPHWKRKLVDTNVEKLRAKDLKWADVVFLSAMLIQESSLKQLIGRCRKAGVPTVVGGPITSAENPCYAEADHIVRGEAEPIIDELIADLKAGKARRVYETKNLADITRVPTPDYSLARLGKYSSMPVQYSRGCPFACEFCDVIELFGRTPRIKTTQQVLHEFERLYHLGWRGSVFLVDDNFVGNKSAIKELLPRITDWMGSRDNPFYLFTQASINLADDDHLLSLMRAARFEKVFIGIETPSAECNRAAGKMQNVNSDMLASVRRLHEFGMEVMGGFIVGFDQDPPEVFEQQIDFIREAAIPVSMVGLLNALPNTRLWRRLSEEGRILRQSAGNNTEALLNYIPKMNPETLLAGYQNVLSSIYSPSEYFERTLTLLSRLGARPYTKRVLSDYLGLVRSFVRQGIFARYRVTYWRFIGKALRCAPKHLGLAVTLAIMGHHFFIMTNRMQSKPSR